MTRPADRTPGRRRRQLLAASAAALVLTPTTFAASPALRFGLTPVFLDDRLRLLRQWQAYLEAALGQSVEFVQRGTYAQVLDALRASQVDFAWVCGYPYVMRQRELQLVAVPFWRRRPLYQSYLITDADSGAKSLADLRGRTFAYSDPLSNSGYLYVQHQLRVLGASAGTFFGRAFFTHSHRHVVEAVAEGLADGGSVDGYVWETLSELHPELTGRTRVVQKSPDFGFPPIVASAAIAPRLVAGFRAALLGMSDQAAGQAVLRELRLDRFDVAPPDLFRGIAEMARLQG